MPIMESLPGFKIKTGSTVRVLTTAANVVKFSSREKYKYHKEQKRFKGNLGDGYKGYQDSTGIFTGVVLDKHEFKVKGHLESHKWPCDVEEYEERPREEGSKHFLVLSLIRPSFPYEEEEVVWIKRDQIVAITTVYDK